jgi:hypothetical protein
VLSRPGQHRAPVSLISFKVINSCVDRVNRSRVGLPLQGPTGLMLLQRKRCYIQVLLNCYIHVLYIIHRYYLYIMLYKFR